MCKTLYTYDKIQKSFITLESTLRQSLQQIKDLDDELQLLRTETECFKTEVQTQKEKCDKQSCSGSAALTKVIETKDCTMAAIVSALKNFMETKDLNFIFEVFKLLQVESSITTLPKDSQNTKATMIKKELHPADSETFTMDVSIDDGSLSGIEGTPTGRTSPIIQYKLKSSLNTKLDVGDLKEKKKCPENWPTPPKKTAKTTTSTPCSGRATRLRQQRLNLSKLRTTTVVDLTSSPEFSGGLRSQKSECCNDVKPVIKNELLDNEETILPSPTSNTAIFPTILYKTLSKKSPAKKKPSLKLKRESDENEKHIESNGSTDDVTNMEDSINLLNQQPNRFKKPVFKIEKEDPDRTNFEDQSTLLKEVNKLEIEKEEHKTEELKQIQNSPSKRPLAENINVTNTEYPGLEASISLLENDINLKTTTFYPTNMNERKPTEQLIQSIYKDPTVRKKAEKRALPGWSCDECKNFYDELYQDDPDMLAKLMNECSKHRGKKNPARPKTPEGFWNPRWNVPDDTEEFNKRNNAV